MRAYNDDYLSTNNNSRDNSNSAVQQSQKSVARRFCCVLLAAMFLMVLAIGAMVLAIIPPLQMFFMWIEARYTIISFAITAFFAAAFMLFALCMPRNRFMLALYIVASLGTIGSLGALCYFFYTDDLTRMGSSWRDSYNSGSFDTLCNFQNTVKCKGWQTVCPAVSGNTTTTAPTIDCPSCASAPNPEWPLCERKFTEDIKMGMPYVMTFSGLILVLLIVLTIFLVQIRNKSMDRRRGAALRSTANYL
eukprot:GILI01031468.1.p1 GENE.GILI01031468.1~~GILI01031468.1.p1  ORF type:complete len:248 (-),score=24.35 GILI01031468.1:42-785(-)